MAKRPVAPPSRSLTSYSSLQAGPSLLWKVLLKSGRAAAQLPSFTQIPNRPVLHAKPWCMPVSCDLTLSKHPLSFSDPASRGCANLRGATHRGGRQMQSTSSSQTWPMFILPQKAAWRRKPGSLCTCVRCNTHRLFRVPAKTARGKAVVLKMRNCFQPCRLVYQGMLFKHLCRQTRKHKS